MSEAGSGQKGTVPVSLLFNCFWHVMKEIEQQRKALWKKNILKEKKLNLFTFQILWGERKGWILSCYLLPRNTKKSRKSVFSVAIFPCSLQSNAAQRPSTKTWALHQCPVYWDNIVDRPLSCSLWVSTKGTWVEIPHLTEKPPNIKGKTHKYCR